MAALARSQSRGPDQGRFATNRHQLQRIPQRFLRVVIRSEPGDDANRQPMALGHEELAEVNSVWPLLSADLRQAVMAIARSAVEAEDDESSADTLSLPVEQRIIGR